MMGAKAQWKYRIVINISDIEQIIAVTPVKPRRNLDESYSGIGLWSSSSQKCIKISKFKVSDESEYH